MNHDYKPKYEQMQDNQPGKQDVPGNDRLYGNIGYGRNVAILLPNGDCDAFNYSYLIRIRYSRSESAIFLFYTFCMVKIEGYNLKSLFLELFDHRNRFIECIDERYKELADEGPVVTKVTVLDDK